MVLEIEEDHGTTHTEKLVRERSGHVHNELDFFSREGWKLPDSLRAQLKFDPFMASNHCEKMFVWEERIQGRETNEACADG